MGIVMGVGMCTEKDRTGKASVEGLIDCVTVDPER